MGCRTSSKSQVLLIDNNGVDEKDKLSWKWRSGAEALAIADFGVPTGTTTYELCIYAAGNLISDAEIPPDPLLWEPRSRGFRYKDKEATPDGIRKINLSAGPEFKSKIIVKGKGTNLPDPALDLPLPVTVQLVNSSNICFEAVFESGGVLYNNSARFKAELP